MAKRIKIEQHHAIGHSESQHSGFLLVQIQYFCNQSALYLLDFSPEIHYLYYAIFKCLSSLLFVLICKLLQFLLVEGGIIKLK